MCGTGVCGVGGGASGHHPVLGSGAEVMCLNCAGCRARPGHSTDRTGSTALGRQQSLFSRFLAPAILVLFLSKEEVAVLFTLDPFTLFPET